VTAIFPHDGDPWDAPVYAGAHVLNGYGETIGINSIREWGILSSPILLTSSQSIGRVYDAAVNWIAGRSREAAMAVMPCVTECDDSWLSDVLSASIGDDDVAASLDGAVAGPVSEGCVGAGVGMQCFDLKGGIGTASRVLDEELGGHTVGALVLTNHGSLPDLRIDGVPLGVALLDDGDLAPHPDGSCIVVVATDAPLLPHQLRRIAERAGMGLARGGSHASNSSGEQFIAFSTGTMLPIDGVTFQPATIVDGSRPAGRVLSALFRATVEATEEAVVNALLAARTTIGRDGHTYRALPIDRVRALLAAANRLAE
jgi:D-aminopeptidase